MKRIRSDLSAMQPRFSWTAARDYSLILLGALAQAAALRLFLVPSGLVSGGVSGLAQLANHYTGWPIGLLVLLGNLPLFVLGWRFLGGARFALRTALIITAHPDRVAQSILEEMGRGVTLISARGAYTGEERTVLYCVISRSEVIRIKTLVREVDARAFMVIGQAHEALGEGFHSLV